MVIVIARLIDYISNLIKEEELNWKYGYDPATRAYRTRTLPIGDPIREAAQKQCIQEYKACFAKEYEFERKYGYKAYNTLEEAFAFANELCKAVGVKPIKGVRLCEPSKDEEAYGAYYKRHKRAIYIRLPVSRIIMVHELAHHIDCIEYFLPDASDHGGRFLKIEQRLFDYLSKK